MAFDIIIKNGMVVNGTGQAGYKADVGITGDKIFDIGNLTKAKAKTEIDASGQVVAPGFIDVQNHSDSYGGILRDSHLESMARQGITTILVGQCGSSLAPLLKGSLASIQKWADIGGINVNWKSAAEFFETMSRRGLGVNLATLAGHATLRRDFIGDTSRPLNPKEELQMMSLLKRSLQEGVYGVSIGLAYTHERLAAEEEIHRLLKVARNYDSVVSFHLRNEGAEIFSSINEVFGFLRHTPVKSKISHLKILGEKNTVASEKLLRMLEVASRDGLSAYFDVYPYTASAVVLYLLLPEWATLGGKNDLIKKIKNKNIRADIARDLETKNYPYDKITIASAALGQNFTGRTLAQIAKDQNTSAPEAVLNLILAARDQVTVFWHDLDENILDNLIKHPHAMIATDGSGYGPNDRFSKQVPHPRSFGATARVLGKYVRERKIINLETAIYKMTAMPAGWLGLNNRGALAKNNFADVVVFDPQNIKDLATYENPFKHPAGINQVIINGQFAVKNGQYQNILAGRTLRRI
ncbi:MAG: D-aminoacylase [Candidatus Sungbacteria bacterium]|uniref:D-aminoacylase n=2 Tax=Candidatus Sungiibacteriota bacterium TaxID=2750080 RepID=A0A931YD84_9BACT|nr:D-aminoacylase [Candidatus Sungbacteria bacterium]